MSTTPRGATAVYRCKCCRQEFTARVADRERGWALFCSKSCKAKRQEASTGQYRLLQQQSTNDQALHDVTAGWDDHKDWT